MIISGIQKLSLVDFDNEISTTIFLAGCNFRCPFCHNFEFVLVDEEKIEHYKEEDVLSYLENRKKYLTGVVITGGEPTLYNELPDFIKKIKNLGYKVKLDTNGSNPEMLKFLVNNNYIDYVAMDIKNSLSQYPKTIGTDTINLGYIKESIDFLLNSSFSFEFRTTLINEFHTTQSIKEMGELIKGAPKLFLQKFEQSEFVPNKELTPVDNKKALEFKCILESFIKNVNLRGY